MAVPTATNRAAYIYSYVDVIDFLHVLTGRSVQLLDVSCPPRLS